MGEGRMDFERIVLPSFDENSEPTEPIGKLHEIEANLLAFLQENYSLVMLSIETNYKKIFESGEKRLEYIDHLRNETMRYFARLVGTLHDEKQSKNLLNLISRFDYLFQVHDSIKDLFNTKRAIDEAYIDLNHDLLMLVRDISSRNTSLFSSVLGAMKKRPDEGSFQVDKDAGEVQDALDRVNRKLLGLIIDPKRSDAGALTHFVTYSQRLKDKLVNFCKTRDTDILEHPGGEISDHMGNGRDRASGEIDSSAHKE